MHIGSLPPASHFFGTLSFVAAASSAFASLPSSSDCCDSSLLSDCPSLFGGGGAGEGSDFVEAICDALADRAPAPPREEQALNPTSKTTMDLVFMATLGGIDVESEWRLAGALRNRDANDEWHNQAQVDRPRRDIAAKSSR
jgi:hypothetical protein